MPKRTVDVNWKCLGCDGEYPTKKQAEDCERMPCTEFGFKVGEKVRILGSKAGVSGRREGIISKCYRTPGKTVHLNAYNINLGSGWFRDADEWELRRIEE